MRVRRMCEFTTLLSVSERAVQDWTKDARQTEKAQQQAKAWEMWLDCAEQKGIAGEIGVDEATVSRWLQERRNAEMQPPASRQHFDVWSFGKADDDAGTGSYFVAFNAARRWRPAFNPVPQEAQAP